VDSLRIDGTENAPSIDFDPGSNVFRMGGLSYLEDSVEFFKPLMADLQSHFGSLNGADVVFEFDMVYFNSSSARYILHIFELLDATAKRGNNVRIVWKFDEEDDTMEEHGEEFGEDIEFAAFEMKAVSDEPV